MPRLWATTTHTRSRVRLATALPAETWVARSTRSGVRTLHLNPSASTSQLCDRESLDLSEAGCEVGMRVGISIVTRFKWPMNVKRILGL